MSHKEAQPMTLRLVSSNLISQWDSVALRLRTQSLKPDCLGSNSGTCYLPAVWAKYFLVVQLPWWQNVDSNHNRLVVLPWQLSQLICEYRSFAYPIVSNVTVKTMWWPVFSSACNLDYTINIRFLIAHNWWSRFNFIEESHNKLNS